MDIIILKLPSPSGRREGAAQQRGSVLAFDRAALPVRCGSVAASSRLRARAVPQAIGREEAKKKWDFGLKIPEQLM